MRATVDFTLFSAPSTAYGTVSGLFDIQESVAEGDVVRVLASKAGDEFSGELRVTSVVRLDGESGEVVVGLEDVVVYSEDEAKSLAARFERGAGLHFDVY